MEMNGEVFSVVASVCQPALPFIAIYRCILSVHNLKNQLGATLLLNQHISTQDCLKIPPIQFEKGKLGKGAYRN